MLGCGMALDLLSVVEDFLGAELLLEPLDQLVVGKGDRRRTLVLGELAALALDLERAAGQRSQRRLEQVPVVLALLLAERRVGREREPQPLAVELDRAGGREQRADHAVLAAHGLDRGGPHLAYAL